MNSGLVSIGAILLIVGVLFTFFTFGFGIVCTGPLMLIGFILMIIGLVLPEDEKKTVETIIKEPETKRYCPNCGRGIPFDANICPYCGKKFWGRKKYGKKFISGAAPHPSRTLLKIIKFIYI